MTIDDDLRQALSDVRKSYRLIWLYQNRVIDIVRLIRDHFDLEFYQWCSNSGSRRADPVS